MRILTQRFYHNPMVTLYATILLVVSALVFAPQVHARSSSDVAEAVQAFMPSITGQDNVAKKYKKFKRVVDIVGDRYVDNVSKRDLSADTKKKLEELYAKERFRKNVAKSGLTNEELAIVGLLQSLDKHSSYMDKKEYVIFSDDSSGKFGGLGIRIKYDDGYIRVMSIFDKTPASKSRLQKNDIITHADGKHLKDYSPTETLSMLRGKPKSPVTLTINRGEKTFKETIVRDMIQIPTEEHRLLKGGIGYIKLNVFNTKATDVIIRAINDLQKRNKGKRLTGLVLDLRHNPGGLLTQAVNVSDLFLSRRPVVKIKRPKNEIVHSSNRKLFYRGKMAVIINAGSASAAEIVSGALRHYERATLIGDKSYGKGTVQTVIPLRDRSAIKLTIARYYLPDDSSVEGGIKPDIAITNDPKTDVDEQLQKAIEIITKK